VIGSLGLLCGSYGQGELVQAGAYRVYEHAAELTRRPRSGRITLGLYRNCSAKMKDADWGPTVFSSGEVSIEP
jgi:hypothetical protein